MKSNYAPGQLNALLQMKCPRCRCGNMFESPTLSTSFMKMNPTCSECGLNYEIEPGFYWGAMYVSYGITCAIMIIVGGLVLLLGNNPDTWVYLTSIIGTFIVASPFTYRISRVLMLHLFSPIKFDARYAKKK